MKVFDVIVLGAGPGGYPAAIFLAQKGMKVALVESLQIGGTCLNRGCIPSKTWIKGAATWNSLKDLSKWGIQVENPHFNFLNLANKKEEVVTSLRNSLEGVLKSYSNIEIIRGFGVFTNEHQIKITKQEGSEEIYGKYIILATGSEPKELSFLPFDQEKIVDSTTLLNWKELPKSLLIIGGGVIGCEFASLFANLGVKITLVEKMERLLPMESPKVSSFIENAFKKKGITVVTHANIEKVEKNSAGVECFISSQKFEAEKVLVSVGRSLNVDKIDLEKAGVFVNEKGLIATNEKMETSVPHIYAIGDISSPYWLAHVATHQGHIAASNICGIPKKMDYNKIPSVTFTDPEIASVGLSLEKAKEKGLSVKSSSYPFKGLGKAWAIQETEGFAEIVVEEKTGAILGGLVIGPDASSLIAEIGLAVANELDIHSLTETIHAHPTLPEIWFENALLLEKTPLHYPKL